jgi:hypothetical protein
MSQDTFLAQMNTALMTVLIASSPALAAAILVGVGVGPNGGSLRNATHMVRDTFPDDRLGNLLVRKVWVLRDCGRADRGQGETCGGNPTTACMKTQTSSPPYDHRSKPWVLR